MTKSNLLISSASAKVPLVRSAIEASTKLDPDIRVIAGDLDEESITRHIANEFWAMPPTKDENISDILDGCLRRGIHSVLPTRDGELAFWARHSEIFADAGLHIIVSPTEAIERCINKILFAEFGRNNELPVIPTSTNIDDIASDLFVVKEQFGAGSRSLGLRLNFLDAVEHAKKLSRPIFQPYIEGLEISIDAWVDSHGSVKGLVLRRRNQVVNGESRITTTFRDLELEAQAETWIEAYGVKGPVVLQVLVDKSGANHLIELNARFGGASTASIKAGLDSLYWSLLEAQGDDISQYPFVRMTSEVRQIRVPSDIYFYGPDF